jgi:hypothetical protein
MPQHQLVVRSRSSTSQSLTSRFSLHQPFVIIIPRVRIAPHHGAAGAGFGAATMSRLFDYTTESRTSSSAVPIGEPHPVTAS